MSTQPIESSVSDSQWWLSTHGKAEGPHDTSFIRAGLQGRSIPAAAYVCPVAGTEWKLIGDWPEFADATTPVTAVAPPASATLTDSPLTNPKLPLMANLICIYAIVVSPAQWVSSGLSNFIVGFSFRAESNLFPIELLALTFHGLVSLIAIIFLVIGGLRFRSLSSSGPTIIEVSILTNLTCSLLMFLFVLGLFMTSSAGDLAESSPAGEVVSFFMILVGLAGLAFEITSVIWLYRNAKSLPLTTA